MARKKDAYYLTYAKLNYEKKTLYFFFYWKGNILDRRDPANHLIQSFDSQKNGGFMAKRDHAEIKLTTKSGQPALAIGEKLVATKK